MGSLNPVECFSQALRGAGSAWLRISAVKAPSNPQREFSIVARFKPPTIAIGCVGMDASAIVTIGTIRAMDARPVMGPVLVDVVDHGLPPNQ